MGRAGVDAGEESSVMDPATARARCRDCGADIVWMVTRNDRYIPIDIVGANAAVKASALEYDSEEGKYVFDTCVLGKHVHFRTCSKRPAESNGHKAPPPPPPSSEADARAALQVSGTACAEVVRAAYKALARLHHPDMSGGDVEMMKRINGAYDRLIDLGVVQR